MFTQSNTKLEMTHYTEIAINGTKSNPTPKLCNSIIELFHLAVVERKLVGEVAVAYPDHGDNLGGRIRLHASEDALSKLGTDCLQSVTRNIKLTAVVQSCPKAMAHRTYFRVRPNKDNAKTESGGKIRAHHRHR